MLMTVVFKDEPLILDCDFPEWKAIFSAQVTQD